MVPDRLSYTEMYYDTFKYPSTWTENFASYEAARPFLVGKIIQFMNNYDKFIPTIRKQAKDLHEQFFSATGLLNNIK